MPRTGGIYSPPAGTKGAPRTTIQSSKYNALVDDLTLDANAARPLTAGGTGATNASQARKNLGSEIGVDVQAFDALLQAIAALTTSANQIIVATGADAVTTKPVTPYGLSLMNAANSEGLRTELGFGTIATLNSINDTNWSGADLSIANGGTGASTAAAARTNLDVPSNAGLTAGLAGKVDIANPQMTGNAVITTTRPTLSFTTTGGGQSWLLDAFPNDSSFRLVDSTAVAEIVKVFTTGAVWTKQLGDLKSNFDAKAPLANAALVGNPTAPTPSTSDNSTRIATTAMVQAAVAVGVPTFFADTQPLGAGSQQNGTGKPMMVNASRSASVGPNVQLIASISSGPNSTGQVVRATNTISPDGGSGSTGVTLSATCSCIIPAGWWFTVSLSGGISASNNIHGTS